MPVSFTLFWQYLMWWKCVNVFPSSFKVTDGLSDKKKFCALCQQCFALHIRKIIVAEILKKKRKKKNHHHLFAMHNSLAPVPFSHTDFFPYSYYKQSPMSVVENCILFVVLFSYISVPFSVILIIAIFKVLNSCFSCRQRSLELNKHFAQEINLWIDMQIKVQESPKII